jgi:hypothetical protein
VDICILDEGGEVLRAMQSGMNVLSIRLAVCPMGCARHMLVGMTYHALLQQLRARSYVMLRPSPIEGIGVFAICDIPKGCREMFGPPDAPDAWVAVPRAEIERLPAHARALVENYCLYDDVNYFVPAEGFAKLDLSLFLNHSDTPNVVSVDEGAFFEAVRDIAVGEELVIDYGEIVDSSS